MVMASSFGGASSDLFGFAIEIMAAARTAAVQSGAWALHSFAYRYEDGTSTHISVVGGPMNNDPLKGLDGVRVPGATPGNDIIYAGPCRNTIEGGQGDDTLTGAGGPNLFIYRMGGSINTIKNFDPEVDRLVIIGADSINIEANSSRAAVRLPDGTIIHLHKAANAT